MPGKQNVEIHTVEEPPHYQLITLLKEIER